MTKKEYTLVFSDGSTDGDWPIAVKHIQYLEHPVKEENLIVDPILNWNTWNNLAGRIFTLVEATTEAHKTKAVMDLYRKELQSWREDVQKSAEEIAKGNGSSNNLYTRDARSINIG